MAIRRNNQGYLKQTERENICHLYQLTTQIIQMYDNKLFIECLQKMKSTALITSNYFKGKAKQTTILKRLLTIAEFTEKTFGLFNCNNKSCETCNYLLFGEHSSLKNAKMIFCLKERFACNSSNLIYLVVCPA